MASAAPSPTAEGGGQAVAEDAAVEQVKGGAAGGADAPGGSEPGEAAPEPKKPRVRKEKMPGVVSRDDSDDIFPDLGFRGRKGGKVSRQEALKELDAEMREEKGVGVFDVPPPPVDPEKAPEDKAPAKKFKFADKEYDSLEAAEQSFKSLQGMHKPLIDRAEKAELLARQWHDYAQNMQQSAAPQPQPQQVQTEKATQETAQAELEKALSKVDGQLFESLAREHGLPLAGRYLAAQVLATVHDEMLPALREEIMAQLKPELEPLQQERGFQQATQHVAGLLDQVAEYRTNDGELAFPELNDEQSVYQIGELWRSLNLPAEVALTPQGLLQAIGLFRLYHGAPQPKQSNTPAAVNVTRPPNVAPSAASASLEGAGAAAPGSGRGPESDAARFARELDGGQLVDPILGFSVRRRR